MAAGGVIKTFTWLIRIFQLLFAIILVGVLSYMIHQFHHFGISAPREVIVPEVFSVLALIITSFSIFSVFFLGHTLQVVAAFFDLVLFAGYLASAILLRHNYHVRSWRNPLRNALIIIRTANGESSRANRNSGLVKLLVGLVVIQLFLFFITTIMSAMLARRAEREKGVGEKRRGHVTV